ncbi:MAG: hypothetical protein ACTHLW_13415 [Verrucomicrobiota bacterium]
MSYKTIIVVGALLAAAALTRAQFNPTITSLSPSGVLTFNEVTNASGYRVEWSTNLAQPSWSTSSPPGVVGIPATGFGSRSVTVGVAQAASFYRVAATLKPPSNRPRGSYYINFQPFGSPASPLVFDGKTWMQVDWKTSGGAWLDYVANVAPYYGWIRDSANQQLSTYRETLTNYSVLERSYVYDDYGRQNTFEFELEPGRYLVTVGVGKPGGSSDPHNLKVEGQVLVNDEVLTDIQARAIEIQLTDGSLTLTFGGKSASTGSWSYTFLAYMKVEPVN